MATSHGIVNDNAPTAAAPQDASYTKAGLGNPAAAILVASHCTAFNSDVANLSYSIGAAPLDASPVDAGVMAGANYEDNQSTTDVKTIISSARALWTADPGTDGLDVTADYKGRVTDGVEYTYDATDVARCVSALLLKEGIDSADAQLVTLSGAGSTTITPGFAADVIIAINTGNTIVATPNTARGGVSFYHAGNYATTYWHGGSNGDSTPDSAERFETTVLGGRVNITLASADEGYTLGNFTSTSFDATKDADSADQVVLFISLKLAAGYSAQVGNFQAPGSLGNADVVTGLSFEPRIALFTNTLQTAINSGSASQMAWNFGACDADAEFAVGGWIEDAGGLTQNSNAGTHHRNDACVYATDNGVLQCAASLSSFGADKITLNFSNVSTQVRVGYLTIGADPVVSNAVSSHHQRAYT